MKGRMGSSIGAEVPQEEVSSQHCLPAVHHRRRRRRRHRHSMPTLSACRCSDECVCVCVLQLDRMEVKLNEKVVQLQGCQERKLQLEESVQHLRPQLRDMKNTLEKYSKSMTVAQPSLVSSCLPH